MVISLKKVTVREHFFHFSHRRLLSRLYQVKRLYRIFTFRKFYIDFLINYQANLTSL